MSAPVASVTDAISYDDLYAQWERGNWRATEIDFSQDRIDWREFGGAPLLGIDGVAVVAHGRSDARAIKNAIRVAKEAVENELVGKIRAEVGKS